MTQKVRHRFPLMNNAELQVLFNKALVYHQSGRLADAEALYRRVLAAEPRHADSVHLLGVIAFQMGQVVAAVDLIGKAIRIKGNVASYYSNLGNALQQLGRFDEALAAYDAALRIKPDFVEALSNRGNALKELGRLADALASLDSALRLRPNYAEGISNRGNVLQELGRLDEALASFDISLRLNPNFAEALFNRGNALKDLGRLDDALVSYEAALRIKPDYAAAFHNLLFALNYHPDKTAEEINAAYAEYDRRFGAPHRIAPRRYGNAPAAGRRLKIGYVSPDFRQHSSRFFLEPLVANHDRAAFELFAYAALGKEDAVTERYKGYFENWIPTTGIDDDALCARIRADKIDILVDLAGHTAKNRLGVFARKPAPVSVSWLGYASTTGLRSIDYLLIDPVSAPPGSEPLFAETPWRLETPAYVFRPAEGMGPEGELPALRRGFVTFGTLTRAVRINGHTVRVWAQILKAVPQSRLTIDSFSFGDAKACEALAARFAAEGIARERLDIGYHSPPWDVLRSIDIGLDCFPHNSGVTLFETLYMGVPYVTLAGRPSVGLIGSSILEGVGHPEWIARSEDEYLDIAVRLARDLSTLARIRSKLRAEMESRPIMDERGFAARVEVAYRQMFEKWETTRA